MIPEDPIARATFFEQQLSVALLQLHAQEAQIAQFMAERKGYDQRVRARYDSRMRELKNNMQQLQNTMQSLGVAAARYAKLRQHPVMCFQLGIVDAEREILDQLVDVAIKKEST